MMLVEETGVPSQALPVAAFREHLQLGTGFADDAVQETILEQVLRAAIAAIEARTGKILISRDFSWTLTLWRERDEQALPVAPVTAIARVVLLDRSGIETEVDPSTWRLIPDMQRPRLIALGGPLPLITLGGSARIQFTAGYGAAWGDIPADLGQAVFLLAAHYYEYRHDTSETRNAFPPDVQGLIERYRTVRLFLGGRA